MSYGRQTSPANKRFRDGSKNQDVGETIIVDGRPEGRPEGEGKTYIVNCVSDGHGPNGREVAFLAYCYVTDHLINTLPSEGISEAVMADCLEGAAWITRKEESGCTIFVSVVDSSTNECTVGFVGDSWMQVFDLDGALTWESDRNAHKAITERERIEKAGGLVLYRRLDGYHMLSRTLGNCFRTEHGLLTKRGMIAEPEVATFKLPADGFIMVLCTDGADEVNIGDICKEMLQRDDSTDFVQDLANGIVDNANKLDDVTAVVFMSVPL